MAASPSAWTLQFDELESRLPAVFDEFGFALVESVFDATAVEAMKNEMKTIVEQLDVDVAPKTIFSTLDADKHASDRFFLDSSAKISHFFEKDAFDESGKLRVGKDAAFNKVGHTLHAHNEVFERYSHHDHIKQIARALHLQHPRIVQSMYIFKQPRIGGAVLEHVDSTFLLAEPMAVGLWLALDESSVENGCLWFAPGSHRRSRDNYRFERVLSRKDENSPLVRFVGQKPEYSTLDFVPVVVRAGSMVLIHGNVVHKSASNESAHSRHAYTLHIAELEDSNKWNELNWLQQSADYEFPLLY